MATRNPISLNHLERLIGAGTVARVQNHLGVRPVGGAQAPLPLDAVLFSKEKVTQLSRSVTNARMSFALSSKTNVLTPPENPAEKEGFCWNAVQTLASGRSETLGLGSGIRQMLTDLLLETMSTSDKPVQLDPSRQSTLKALRDSDLVRVLVFLREDLIDQLKIRLATKGAEYPENPFAQANDYSILMQRSLVQLPAVAAMVQDPTFALKTVKGKVAEVDAERVQRLVFEALRLYPKTVNWATQASTLIGEKSISAFAPGGFDALGNSVLFTVLKQNPQVWEMIEPAVTYARENFIDFGSRSDELFRAERALPWNLLGYLYELAKPNMQKPTDTFHAFAAYRKVFTEEKPITKDEFYRNVGVLALRMMETNYRPGPDLFDKLIQPDFEKGFESSMKGETKTTHTLGAAAFLSVFADKMQANSIHFTEVEKSALPAFFNAKTPEAMIRAFGRVLSTEPFGVSFFEKDHKMYLGHLMGPTLKQCFAPDPQDIDVSHEVPFSAADRKNISQLCNVMRLYRESQLSFPYTIVERLYGVSHSAKALPVNPEVVEVLQALPPEGIVPFSPSSLALHGLRQFLDQEGTLLEMNSDVLEFTKSTIRMRASALGADGFSDRTRELELMPFYMRIQEASSLQAVFAIANQYPNILKPLSREEFNNHCLDSTVMKPLAQTETPFGYTPSDYESLRRTLKYPVGLSFLDRRLDPDPFTVVRAGAYFEQQGAEPDAFWAYHLQSLKESVKANPIPVFQPGKKFNQDARLLDAEVLGKGCLDAYSHILGMTKEETPALGSEVAALNSVAGGRLAWDSPRAWEDASRGIDLLEKQVKSSLGHSSDLGDVSTFLKLTASYYPQLADFFLSGADAAEKLLSPEPFQEIHLSSEQTLENIRQKLGQLNVNNIEPPYGRRSLVQIPE